MRLLLVGLMASLVLTTPLQARTGTTITVKIPHGDLDLSTADGVARLKERSVRAIGRACSRGPYFGPQAVAAQERCQSNAEADAVQLIDQRRGARVTVLQSAVD